MKITIEKKPLLTALAAVAACLAARQEIPILNNIKLTATSGELQITGTDLDVEIRASVNCNEGTDGATTVSGALLASIVKNLPDGGEICLETRAGAGLAIVAGRVKFELPVLPAGDYPLMLVENFDIEEEIPASDLLRLLDTVGFAASTDETRYYLGGVYIHIIDGHLRAVATDGHRLGLAECAVKKSWADMPGIIIPRKTVALMTRMLAGQKNKTVKLAVDATKVRLDMDGAVLTSRIIDGTFPDYDRVIPKDAEQTWVVDTEALVAAVNRAALLSQGVDRLLEFGLSADNLTITAPRNVAGKSEERLTIDYSGDDFKIGLNARYMLETLGRIKARDVVIPSTHNDSPIKIKDTANPDAVFIIMPLKI